MDQQKIIEAMNKIDFKELYNKFKNAVTNQEKLEAMKNFEIAEQRWLGYEKMLETIENIRRIEEEYAKDNQSRATQATDIRSRVEGVKQG